MEMLQQGTCSDFFKMMWWLHNDVSHCSRAQILLTESLRHVATGQH